MLGEYVGQYGDKSGPSLTQPLGSNGGATIILDSMYVDAFNSTQSVTGTVGLAPFTGSLTASSDYARADDSKTYRIAGFFDPTGAAPPAPMDIRFEFTNERVAEHRKVTFGGTIGGQPIVGSGTIFEGDVPTGYQLVP